MEYRAKKHYSTVLRQNERVADICEPLLDETLKEIQCSPPTQNLEEIQSKYRSFLSDQVYASQERMRALNGFDLIFTHLQKVPNGALCEKELRHAATYIMELLSTGLSENQKQLLNRVEYDISQIKSEGEIKEENINPTASKEKSIDEKTVGKFISEAVPLKELMGISDSTFASMYEIGCLLFEENKIEEAISVFEMVSMLDVTCHEIWFSLGLCHQRLNKFIEAIGNYKMAIMTNALNMQSYINMAYCYIAGENKEEAEKIQSMITAAQKKLDNGKLI